MMKINQILKIIKTKRKRKDISHEDFAFRIGISQAAYTNLENQTSKLSVERLLKIAEILEEPIQNFFKEEVEQYNQDSNYISREIFEEYKKSIDEQIAVFKDLLEKTDNISHNKK